jgi:geranylgeranyl diphosphate synthase type II
MADCREVVIREIRKMLPRSGRYERILYRLILDYPLREAKGLRPTLAIATCRALGHSAASVMPTAAVLELFHNAFLVHDDVEDESEMRRGGAALHQQHGVPIAVNVGDAMLCLALEPLLGNVQVVGLGPALMILQAVAEMTRRTVEGQSIELDWVKRGTWDLADRDYVTMVVAKTGWYSFMTPMRVAAIVAALDDERTAALVEFARVLSVAFQIQDDLLNLRGEVQAYGKEIGGDLWEGKRTLILLHMLRSATASERAAALEILSLSRPRTAGGRDAAGLALLADLEREPLSPAGRAAVRRLQTLMRGGRDREKRVDDVRRLFALIRKYRSTDYAAGVARTWANRAGDLFDGLCAWIPASPHRDVIRGLVDFVHVRHR